MKKSSNKVFSEKQNRILFLFLFSLIVIGALLYVNIYTPRFFIKSATPLVHPTGSVSSPTSRELLTYTNTTSGISFQYPSDWDTITSSAQSASPLSMTLVGLKPREKAIGTAGPLIQILIWSNPDNLSLPDYQQQVGKQVLGSCTLSSCDHVIFVPLKGKLLELESLNTPSTKPYDTQKTIVLQQVLSSLHSED